MSPFPTSKAEFDALLEQADQDLNILVLVTGKLADGSDHYAYASIPPSKYEAFKRAEAAGNYDLGKFGNILKHGKGLEPPDAVRKQMEEQYGADHNFEEEMLRMQKRAEKIVAEIMKEEEKK